MKMMDHDVASLAALEVASRILYDNTPLPMEQVLDGDGNLTAVSYQREGRVAESLSRKEKSPSGRTVRKHGKIPHNLPRTVRKTKEDVENNINAPSTTGRKPDKKGMSTTGNPRDKTDVPDVIIDHLQPQPGDGVRKHLNDTNRKPGKLHRSYANASELLLSAVRSTARPTRKVTKSSLRRFKRNSGQKSMGVEENIPAAISITELIENKAENNNWMLETEETSNTQGGFVVPTLHIKSCAPCFNSLIQPNSDCKAALRTTSIDNSCGVLSLPTQGSNVLSDCNLDKYSPDEKLIKPAQSPDSKRVTGNTGVCVACGNDIQTPKCTLCKHCSVRHRPDDNRNGPLDELKAYAQSFANSVKKILLISPVLEQSSEILHSSTPGWNHGERARSTPQEDTVPRKSGPEIGLNRYMTEINMARHPETSSKSVLSKSMSYDGRIGTSMEEKGSRSPLHWISQDRIKAVNSFSKISECNLSRIEGDSLITEKEEKQFLVYEGDKNRINRAEKLKTKMSKQLARVERAKTDGDLRTNNPQPTITSKKQVKDEPKKGGEFQRNRSKTFHELDAGSEDQVNCSPQREEDTDINISRLKVIHEGTPVDPPNTADSRKSDDGRSRKVIRSATAPYKNHLPRKEITTSLTVLDGSVRSNRSNTKITVRTNKASTLRKENSLSDRRQVSDMLEAYADDASVITSMSFTKRRSTSYDSSQVAPKRDELHRSSSWSVIDGDEEESKHRRESPPASCVSANRRAEQGRLSVNGVSPARFRVSTKKGYQSREDMPVDPFLYSELVTDTFKNNMREAWRSELSADSSQDRFHGDHEDELQLKQAQTEYDFELGKRYYDDGVEKRLSPCIEEEELPEVKYDTHFDNESYYTETAKTTNHEVENVMKIDGYNDNSDFKTVDDDECVYHNEINKYVSSDVSHGKNSPWYSPLQVLSSDDRSSVRRDRSLESKSTTSFHIVSMAKSSHSDEAVTKYSGVLEHAMSRRLSMYTETDVDTGLIYHLAKRQTTRAHVPPYHDLTSVSREIYTMSGDVSTSTSSNSANSTRSELSECVYTGGFYKDDPFYDNKSKGSRSSSSEDSRSNIYFDSKGTSKRELSEIDIYTGSIFNSNQNTMTSSHVAVTESVAQANHVKDNRIITSARSAIGRMQRSVRCRPRVDAITFRNNDCAWEYFSQPVVICGESKCCNVSNNSNNFYAMDDFETPCPNGTIITKSVDPLYTDYDPGMRPEFHVRHIEKSGSVFDFLKYDSADEPNKTFFTPPRRDESSSDSIWYSGLLHDQSIENAESRGSRSHHSLDRSPYSWQYHDDYYTSTVRPIVNKTNNCNKCASVPCDANNNHFDDIYTGSYGAQNAPPTPQEQPQNSRQPAPESWHVKQPTPTYTSSTVYEQGYNACYAVPGPARRSASDVYEPLRDPCSTYSSSKVFGQEPPTASESSVYLVDDGWWKYGPKTSSQPDEPQIRRPEKPPSGEPESYFHYASKISPERNFYVIDDDTYSFEQKVESEAPEAPVVKEIKTVGGIVCRENVANKDDYAEDINRDLEPGAWVPFTFRRDEDSKYPQETAGSHDKQEIQRASEAVGQNMKHIEETYANNRLYDNFGARKNWQRTSSKQENNAARSRDSSQHRAFQAGDTGKQDHSKSLTRNSTDIIPDKARGKRSMSNAPKSSAAENSSNANKGSGSSTASKNKRR